jgi:hypothetical protein
MPHHRIAMTAAALVLAGGIGAGSYELASSGDHASPANPAAATTSSPENGHTTGTASFVTEDDAQNGPDHVDAHRTDPSGGATLTQGDGVTSGSASHGTMTSSGSQQTPPPPPPKPKGLLDNPLAKKIAETQVYK